MSGGTPRRGDADRELLAAFAEFVRAWAACNEAGDPDDYDCPIMAAYHASRDAFDALPPPVSIAGAAAALRFGLAVNNTYTDETKAILLATPAERAAFCRDNWDGLNIDTRPYWAALIALEAVDP